VYIWKVKKVGNILKNLRVTQGLSLKLAAQKSNLDQSLLSRIEHGKRHPTKNQLFTLSDLYHGDKKEIISHWLSEKIYAEVENEEFALEALQLAEQKFAYRRKSFSEVALLKEIDQLKAKLDRNRPLEQQHLKKLLEYYKVEYTYDSNQIEGNTLSLRETALVVEKGITISGKSVQEHLEAINHAEAVDLLLELVESKLDFNQHRLLELHALVLRGIDKHNAGKYRSVNVRISGSRHEPPEPYLLSTLMEDLFIFYEESKDRLHPVVLAAEMHERLVTIHPFIDGNGRTARLVMNLILMKAGFPITNIKSEKTNRLNYYNSLETAQTEGSKEGFIKFIAQHALNALQEFLKLSSGE
jgi:Fic family protein